MARRLRNLFKAIDIDKGKVIFEEELNRGVTNLIPDSFFVKKSPHFIKRKEQNYLVCSLKE
jgi:hypothetical protein